MSDLDFSVSTQSASTPGLELSRAGQHVPTLLRLDDGRWEVQCPQCALSPADARPVGIGLAIVNRDEAEGIMRNHAGGGTSRAEVA